MRELKKNPYLLALLLLFALFIILNNFFPIFKKANFYYKIIKWKLLSKDHSHFPNILGYRSDCSGFVSYMWNLDNDQSCPGGPRVRGEGKSNLQYWGKKINKNLLKQGDIILVPEYHCLIFDKWADENKDEYYLYEQCAHTTFCNGLKHRKVKYPYNLIERPKFLNPILLRKNSDI